MRILYIDHYAGSPTLGMEYRPHAMAERWMRSGHTVTLLAGSFSHLRAENPDVRIDGEHRSIDGADFRFILTRSYDGNGIARVFSMGDFVVKGWLQARRISKALRPDVVIASSTYPFDTWLAQRIARLSGAGLVHEVHDLWPLTPMELGGYSPRHPLMWLMARAERSAYAESDVVVSILPNIEPHVRSLGVGTPVVHVPNGIEASAGDQPAPEDLTALVATLHAEGRTVIGYAGGMSTSNALDDFIVAMGLLRDEPISAVLIGDGMLRPELEKLAVANGAAVHFVGRVPKRSVGAILRHMDGLYIGSKRSPLYEFGVSANKIFDYLLTGVPIVNAFATVHSPLKFAQCSLDATAEDPGDIARALRKIAVMQPEEAAERGRRGVEYVLAHHSMDALADDMLRALEQAADSHGHSAG